MAFNLLPGNKVLALFELKAFVDDNFNGEEMV